MPLFLLLDMRAAGRYRLRHLSMLAGASASDIGLPYGLTAVLSADQIRISRPMTRIPETASIESWQPTRL